MKSLLYFSPLTNTYIFAIIYERDTKLWTYIEYLMIYLFGGFQGRFKYQPNQVRAFGMIAGGTGITPMFQVSNSEV